VKLKMEKKLH